MKIKVNETAVYKIIPKEQFSSFQLNDIFEECLSKVNQIFAPFSALPGQYVWTLPEADWKRLSTADETMYKAVVEELGQLRASIAKELSQFPALNIESIMAVPNEDYIYYTLTPNNQIRLMLVAWDYKLPAKQDSDRIVFKTDVNKQRQDIALKIVEIGKHVPDYGLVIKLHNGKYADKQTDQDGIFRMPGMIVGQPYNIYSADRKHDFSFVAKAGVSEYVYDITQPAQVTVKVLKDGQPLADARVEMNVEGEKYILYTNSEGIASSQLTYKPGITVEASVEDQTSSHSLDYPDTFIEFALESPVVVPEPEPVYDPEPEPVDLEPEYYSLSVREQDNNGPFSYDLRFSQNGREVSPIRDAADKFRFPKDAILDGNPVKVDVNKNSEVFGDIDITFERSESEYELILARETREKKGSRIKEIIVALLTALIFIVGLFFLLNLVA